MSDYIHWHKDRLDCCVCKETKDRDQFGCYITLPEENTPSNICTSCFLAALKYAGRKAIEEDKEIP